MIFISNHISRCSRQYIITSVLIILLVILIIATILLVLLIKSPTKRIIPSNIELFSEHKLLELNFISR